MILLDTHIFIWLVSNDSQLSAHERSVVEANRASLGVSIISVWEIATKVARGKLGLDRAVDEWVRSALSLPGIELLPLTPEIVLDSTQLPQPFHRDPAEQLIVATARVLGIGLLTRDEKLVGYSHVTTL